MSDLISRQDAIDALNKLDVSDGVGISSIACDLQEEAIRSIENLPSAQTEQMWIPVSERLPKEDGTYIVSGVWGSREKQVGESNFRVDDGCFRISWYFDVEAWMPLPEPYKGE